MEGLRLCLKGVRLSTIGITNAWDDPNYIAAILEAANGRKNVIVAGLINDVCIVCPSISMVERGFDVQVVIDTRGSLRKYPMILRSKLGREEG